ncbi:type IV pilus modification protein PilV [Derxia gummosa]|uniref:Type IV pilus modification protein PilV n=1 Tax=Derxia gummosa DSM 723 TaxID=1121388 RepID=A0A8B6X9T2_9BURK|nr:type IV pilus modification protein PilV [Derxia gummosa]
MDRRPIRPGGLPARQQRGFSLIEVLIVLIVVSIGLIGLAGLQVNAMSYGLTAVSRSTSASLAYDMADRMRANLSGLVAGNYLLNQTWSGSSAVPAMPSCFTTATGVTAGNCTAAEIAAIDLNQWTARVAAELPSGRARIEALDGSGKVANFRNGVRIIVGYSERNAAASPSTAPGTRNAYSTSSNCPTSFNSSNSDPSIQCFQLDVAP